MIEARELTRRYPLGDGGVMALLGRLNRERGVTVLLVTHEAGVAAHAGRVIHLRDGRTGSDERRPAAA
jgi:putative ABC transport system ATP-binding protein